MQMTIQRRYVRYFLPGPKGPNSPFITVLFQSPKGVAAMAGRVAAMSPERWLPCARNPGSLGPEIATSSGDGGSDDGGV